MLGNTRIPVCIFKKELLLYKGAQLKNNKTAKKNKEINKICRLFRHSGGGSGPVCLNSLFTPFCVLYYLLINWYETKCSVHTSS